MNLNVQLRLVIHEIVFEEPVASDPGQVDLGWDNPFWYPESEELQGALYEEPAST